MLGWNSLYARTIMEVSIVLMNNVWKSRNNMVDGPFYSSASKLYVAFQCGEEVRMVPSGCSFSL